MLPGFDVIPATSSGGTFTDAPSRVVLHTTEGSSIAGAVGAYPRATGSWPHFTVDPKTTQRTQHYDLSTSARALLHRPRDPETNRAGAIQIEIVGFATQTPAWPVEWLNWLGAQVLNPIHAARPFALTAPDFVRYPDSYGFGAAQRLTWDSWAKFNGICGHQHVPGNDHGDPGAIDVTAIITALGHTDPAPSPIPHPIEDDDMAVHIMRAENEGEVYIVAADLQSRVHATSPEFLVHAKARLGNRLIPPPPGAKTEDQGGVTVEIVAPDFLHPIPIA